VSRENVWTAGKQQLEQYYAAKDFSWYFTTKQMALSHYSHPMKSEFEHAYT
jgi:hypothetical protein